MSAAWSMEAPSPVWPPQATLAEERRGQRSSSPSEPSPRSALRSITTPLLSSPATAKPAEADVADERAGRQRDQPRRRLRHRQAGAAFAERRGQKRRKPRRHAPVGDQHAAGEQRGDDGEAAERRREHLAPARRLVAP